VSVDLDEVAVGVGDLAAHESPVILPFDLGDAGCAEALARNSHGRVVRKPEPEMV
jgi:hypothetical protein